MKAKVISFVAFQLTWFACILGAGYGVPWVGVAVVCVSAALHIWYARQRSAWIMLLFLSILVGLICDGIVMSLGALAFPEHAKMLTPVPLWMLCMWVNFAFAIPLSLGWLKGRYLLATLFGLLGGPGAYYTGMRLDAVLLGDGLVLSLFIIGVEWAIATPLLVFIANKALLLPSARSQQNPMKKGALQ